MRDINYKEQILKDQTTLLDNLKGTEFENAKHKLLDAGETIKTTLKALDNCQNKCTDLKEDVKNVNETITQLEDRL